MTLHVFTARISCKDPDALDVTRKSGREGLFLAPSWAILGPALTARKRSAAIMAECSKRTAAETGDIPTFDPFAYQREAEDIEAAAWAIYEPAFIAEMRRSYRTNRAAWDALLVRQRVVLLCYCVDPALCHRRILRADILPKLGAVDAGELPATLRNGTGRQNVTSRR